MNPPLNDGTHNGNHNGDGHKGNRGGGGYHDHDGDHHHHGHDGGGPWVYSWYGYGYPGWGWYPYYPYYPYYAYYPYPYVIDPGFYDWNDSSDSAYTQGNAAPGYGYGQAPPDANYGAQPYTPQEIEPPEPAPESDPRPPYSAPPGTGLTQPSSFEPAPPLTVIFRNGRAPEQIQNYMLSASLLTNLDPQHYEQIPLYQIDIAATVHANSSRGVQFVIPASSRD